MSDPTVLLRLTRNELKVINFAVEKLWKWEGGIFGARLSDFKVKLDEADAFLIFEENALSQLPPIAEQIADITGQVAQE